MALYENLLQKFKPDAVSFELDVPYMYLDSRGYLTIGIGHKISELSGTVANSLIQSLSIGDHSRLLPDTEVISKSDLDRLMRDMPIRNALKAVQNLPFRLLEVEKEADIKNRIFFAKPIPLNACSVLVVNAFIELLKQSIKLKARLKKDPKFKGYVHTSFFNTKTHPGPNNLVINNDEINRLYLKDASEKIKNLRHYFSVDYYKKTLSRERVQNKAFSEWYKNNFKKEPEFGQWKGFDDFPEPVQLALLDMAYNMGAYGLVSKFVYFSQLVREEKWGEILKTDYTGKPLYYRSGEAFQSRNKKVGDWFKLVNSMCWAKQGAL